MSTSFGRTVVCRVSELSVGARRAEEPLNAILGRTVVTQVTERLVIDRPMEETL